MAQLDGSPDLAVEQAPPQLQNLVSATNALLASFSSIAQDLQAASAAQNGPSAGQQLDAAIDQARLGQESLTEVARGVEEDILSETQADLVDRAAEVVGDVAAELGGPEAQVSDQTRAELQSTSEAIQAMTNSLNDRLAEMTSSFPSSGSDTDVAAYRAGVADLSAQVDTLGGAQNVVDAAMSVATTMSAQEAVQSIAAESLAAIDAQNSEEIEKRIEERMAREG